MNAKEWAQKIEQAMKDAENGKISVQLALGWVKAMSTVGTTYRDQTTYQKLRGEKPEIDFFNN